MNSTNETIIEQAEEFVKRELASDRSGHDWWHISRVRRLSLQLAEREQADAFICELAALLHDVADEKLNTSKEAGLHKVEAWLQQHVEDEHIVRHVMTIISTMSFNGGKNPPMSTIEGQVVQDADRLDALGAIGIARTFTYAGSKGHYMHNPGLIIDESDYRRKESTAIHHFYEKLLKLKDLMNTPSGRQLAEERHTFMEQFLARFLEEWG